MDRSDARPSEARSDSASDCTARERWARLAPTRQVADVPKRPQIPRVAGGPGPTGPCLWCRSRSAALPGASRRAGIMPVSGGTATASGRKKTRALSAAPGERGPHYRLRPAKSHRFVTIGPCAFWVDLHPFEPRSTALADPHRASTICASDSGSLTASTSSAILSPKPAGTLACSDAIECSQRTPGPDGWYGSRTA